MLRRIIESGNVPNLIFYGPSGTGKTTVANLIARRTNRTLHKLNATTASLSDLREVMGDVGTLMAPNGVLLYLDEIQYFNKKQQQSLLEFMESGKLTLIASTTENPYFYVYNAVLSRATVFEFKPVTAQEVTPALERAFHILEERKGLPIRLEDGVLEHLAHACGGDVRKGINAVELLVSSAVVRNGEIFLSLENAVEVAQHSAVRYDREDDSHYDILSAFQKSIRGSDPDAALHYLARLLAAGDLISPCRRLLVIAAEDIGLAYPQAMVVVKSCVDAANQLGLPEARIPLAEATVLLATAPKSNSAICGIDAAMSDLTHGKSGEIPAHLRDSHYSGAAKLGRGLTYQYPHEFSNHWTKQQYLPDELVGRRYYEYGENKTEQAAKAYWDRIKGQG
jgi:putative ATPase